MTLETIGPGVIPTYYGARTGTSPTRIADAGQTRQIYQEYEKSSQTSGFKDLTSSVNSGGVPAALAPIRSAFGPSGLYEVYRFAVNDYIFLEPFHVNHDIKPGGKAYMHVHWSTNGTNVQPVRWELQYSRALGHNQANYPAPTTITLTQTPHGTAWRHMIIEAGESDVLTLLQPDELINVVLRRVSNGGIDNTDQIFGLTADLHFESDRDYTPLKVPPFYL